MIGLVDSGLVRIVNMQRHLSLTKVFYFPIKNTEYKNTNVNQGEKNIKIQKYKNTIMMPKVLPG